MADFSNWELTWDAEPNYLQGTVVLDELISRLVDRGVGGTSSTDTWRIVGREFIPGTVGTSTQAQQICVTQTGGFAEIYAEELERPTFQVRIRGDVDSSTGLEAKVEAVTAALNLMDPSTNYGRKYLGIFRQGDTLYLGRDENQRPVYAVNFLALRSRTT